MPVSLNVMEKGYDSEEIHRIIRQDLHEDLIIPIRSWNNKIIEGDLPQGNGFPI